ncbi:helix-turn-helix transcriptional regulator [Hoeflea sp.]|uniref:helix-turn-helix transcriptional regulator n=1 Tax=Hoeflea sp. TaxID=1940281 RepID=UPI003B01C141
MQNDKSDKTRKAFLNAKEAAEYLGLKPNTLAKMRVYGNGPKFRKHGFRVLYAIDDLNAWSEGTRRSSTSETPRERD